MCCVMIKVVLTRSNTHNIVIQVCVHETCVHMITNKIEVNLVKFFRRFFVCTFVRGFLYLFIFIAIIIIFNFFSVDCFLLRIYNALCEHAHIQTWTSHTAAQRHRNTKSQRFSVTNIGYWILINWLVCEVACTRDTKTEKQNKPKQTKPK